MLWLKKLLTNWFRPQVVEIPKPLSIRQQGLKLLNGIQENLSASIDPSEASGLIVACVKPNILEFIEVIRVINESLKNHEEALSPIKCYFTEVNVDMDSFFHAKEGYYIPYSKIKDYITVVKAFYEFTESTESAEVGVHEHNKRMLTKLFVSVKNVNEALSRLLRVT